MRSTRSRRAGDLAGIDQGARPDHSGRAPAPSRGRRWGRRALAGIGLLLILAELAVFVGPRVLPYRILAVYSGSMEPTFHVGSVIIDVPAEAADLGVGDVITFTPPGRSAMLESHRIARVVPLGRGRGFVTKGDANGAPDAWVVPVEGRGWRAVATVPALGRPLAAIESPRGHLVLTGLLVFSLCFWVLSGSSTRADGTGSGRRRERAPRAMTA